jgi:hypothetical protein
MEQAISGMVGTFLRLALAGLRLIGALVEADFCLSNNLFTAGLLSRLVRRRGGVGKAGASRS